MREIVFAWPAKIPDSYTDLRKLVTVSEFRQCLISEIDENSASFYIVPVATRELYLTCRTHRDYRDKARVAWWNLEKPDSGHWPLRETHTGASTDIIEISKLVDFVLTSDNYTYRNIPKTHFMVLGSSLALAENGVPATSAVRYDICHASAETPRRLEIIKQLSSRNLCVAPAPWGPERANYLQNSRVMLNVHQREGKFISPLRFALAAAYNLPVISEEFADPYPFISHIDYISSSYESIVEVCSNFLSSPEHERILDRFATRLRELLIYRYPFRETIIRKVEELER